MFGSIFKSLRNMTGISLSPKGVKVSTPKWNVGDALNLGLSFGTGNLAGMNSFKDLGKMGLQNLLKNSGLKSLANGTLTMQDLPGIMGALQSLQGNPGSNALRQLGYSLDGKNPDEAHRALIQMLSPLVQGEIDFQKKLQPQFQQTLLRAIAESDPSLNAQRGIKLGNEAARNAMMTADQEAQRFGTMGYSPALTDALRLGAKSEGNAARNDALERAMDPNLALEQRRQQISMMTDADLSSSLDRARQMLAGQFSMDTQTSAARDARPRWSDLAMQYLGDYAGQMTQDDFTKLLRQIGILKGGPSQNTSGYDWSKLGTRQNSLSNPLSLLLGGLLGGTQQKGLPSTMGIGYDPLSILGIKKSGGSWF